MAEKKTKKKSRPNGGAAGKGGGAVPGSPMDVGLLEQLVRLMADNDLNTVDVRDGDKRVILKRGPAVVAMPAGAASYAAGPPPAPASHPAVGGGGGAPGAAQPTAEVDDDAGLVPILSPMVGTFYTAPKPGERPYVSVGSKVVKDETDVCQIEAMKNFFVQKADVTGTIVRVLVDNGQPVQVEQPMFLVKPA